MDRDPLFDHLVAQGADVARMAIDDAGCNEALEGAAQWAAIAQDRLVEKGAPAISASSLIIGVVNLYLLKKLLEPPASEGTEDDLDAA